MGGAQMAKRNSNPLPDCPVCGAKTEQQSWLCGGDIDSIDCIPPNRVEFHSFVISESDYRTLCADAARGKEVRLKGEPHAPDDGS